MYKNIYTLSDLNGETTKRAECTFPDEQSRPAAQKASKVDQLIERAMKASQNPPNQGAIFVRENYGGARFSDTIDNSYDHPSDAVGQNKEFNHHGLSVDANIKRTSNYSDRQAVPQSSQSAVVGAPTGPRSIESQRRDLKEVMAAFPTIDKANLAPLDGPKTEGDRSNTSNYSGIRINDKIEETYNYSETRMANASGCNIVQNHDGFSKGANIKRTMNLGTTPSAAAVPKDDLDDEKKPKSKGAKDAKGSFCNVL